MTRVCVSTQSGVLGAYTLGPVEIDISSSEAEAMPSVAMDESYRLSIDEGVISLSSNAVWVLYADWQRSHNWRDMITCLLGCPLMISRALPGAGCCSM